MARSPVAWASFNSAPGLRATPRAPSRIPSVTSLLFSTTWLDTFTLALSGSWTAPCSSAAGSMASIYLALRLRTSCRNQQGREHYICDKFE